MRLAGAFQHHIDADALRGVLRRARAWSCASKATGDRSMGTQSVGCSGGDGQVGICVSFVGQSLPTSLPFVAQALSRGSVTSEVRMFAKGNGSSRRSSAS
mmetsp:Transcript_18493/g.55220  ORF Transcript_18493/g.55220 Transcript_18493/m.55220 type:complete len:100 (-) Transcript_18493:128-427(-)